MVAIPKFEYFRSQKHLNIIRSLPCCGCGGVGRSQAAHSNQGKHGKGSRIKSCDTYVIPCCIECHRYYDQSKDRQTSVEWFDKMHKKVIELLKQEGKLLPEAERLLKLRGVL